MTLFVEDFCLKKRIKLFFLAMDLSFGGLDEEEGNSDCLVCSAFCPKIRPRMVFRCKTDVFGRPGVYSGVGGIAVIGLEGAGVTSPALKAV